MRLWFNRGFSLAPIAAAMREAEPDLEIYVSVAASRRHRTGPTATWTDPDIAGPEYVAWVTEMIGTHGIDIFVPTRERQLLAMAPLPCRVELPASIAVLDLLEDKFAFAATVADTSAHLRTELITSAQELADALARFDRGDDGETVPCIKPRRGVNGHGFWRLMPDQPMSHLIQPEDRKIMDRLYIDAVEASETIGMFQDLVLMEYLSGPEVSIDILAHRGTMLKMAARTKSEWGQRIQTDHVLAPQAAGLIERFGLHGVVNVQFRQAGDGNWKLLEINARPAGGIVYSEAVGCGLLADWAALLTGRIQPRDVHQASVDARIGTTTTVMQIAA